MESVNSKTLELTEDEKATKQFLVRLFTVGDDVPCDTDLTNFKANIPSWYDDVKYKRAQDYFTKNRTGIFESNMVGLISLLAQNRGLQILCSTGRSSTADTARKRYISTILHTLSWYENDLTPGSKSWESLMRVRKLHLLASRASQEKKLGFISQLEMAITQFGFMGLVLVRPHIFNIEHDNEEDIEAFIHMWAVIGFMLGIRDENNICLLPVKLVIIASQVLLRYFMLPALQLEAPKFKMMTKALLEGLAPFSPFMSYELQVFLARRACSVPGYQRNLNIDKEVLCRSIFTDDDFNYLLAQRTHVVGIEYAKFLFFEKVPVYSFIKNKMVTEMNGNVVSHKTGVPEDIVVESGKKRSMDAEFAKELRSYLELDDDISITLTLVDYETEWKGSLNDSMYFQLRTEVQGKLQLADKMKKFFESRIGHYICDWLISLLMWRYRRYLNSA